MTDPLGCIDLNSQAFWTCLWRSGVDKSRILQAALLSGLNRPVIPCLGWASS